MVAILNVAVPAEQFELGRILGMQDETRIVLETMVPMGERTVPFFRVYQEENSFEESVQDHQAVEDIEIVSTHDGEVLYALDWDISTDTFFQGLIETDADLLQAQGTVDQWLFELRFPTHEALSSFQAYCNDHDIPIDVHRLYNPTTPEAGAWYGLSPQQRTTLTRAVEAGYYSIPRQTSTAELAVEFDITDQAVTERLRRGIRNLVSSTLLLSEGGEAAEAVEQRP